MTAVVLMRSILSIRTYNNQLYWGIDEIVSHIQAIRRICFPCSISKLSISFVVTPYQKVNNIGVMFSRIFPILNVALRLFRLFGGIIKLENILDWPISMTIKNTVCTWRSKRSFLKRVIKRSVLVIISFQRFCYTIEDC